MTTAAEFKAMWESGLSGKEIRDRCGYVTEHCVYTRANALGLKRRKYKDNELYRRMLPYTEDIVYAIEAGLRVSQIADEIGVSRGYLYKLYHDVTE